MFSVFWDNFVRFDFLIFLLAVGNFFIYWRTRRSAKKIRSHLFPGGYVPGGEAHSAGLAEHYRHYLSPSGESELLHERRKMNFFYSMYFNITSIFPLMGILGTVISLIGMVNRSSEQVQQNFLLALTSTLWGIIFAIVFKAVNGYLASVIDNLDEVFELYIERNSRTFQHKECTATKTNGNQNGMTNKDRKEIRTGSHCLFMTQAISLPALIRLYPYTCPPQLGRNILEQNDEADVNQISLSI